MKEISQCKGEVMNKIKENKKVFAIILIISLLAILLGSYAIYKSSNKDETANKIEKSEKLEKKAEKKLKEARMSGDKEEIAKAEKELKEAEEKTEEVKSKKSDSSSSASSSNASTSKSTPTASKPSTSSSSAAASTKPSPKPKEKQKVWVVDKPAWTETVVDYDRPVETWIAVDEGSGIERKFYDYDEAMSEKGFLESGLGHVYNGETEYPYTKTITHPEQGHWEYR